MKNLLLISALSVACVSIVSAQTATKPSQQTGRIVKGTTQMAGDNGKLNVAYTIGKTDSINITVTSVRYSLVREIVGSYVVAPSKEEKLLVIDFVAHNPNPKALPFDGGALKFTGVDQESVNRPYNGQFTRAKTGELFNTDLKPAQKVELRTVIVVPAAGTVPKLIVEHRTGGPVLRYDLKPALKPLTAPFVDPKDETGMSALDVVNCTPDEYMPLSQVDMKYVTGSFAAHGTRFGPNTCPAGKTFASIKLTFKGQSPMAAGFRFQGEFLDENGEKYPVLKIAQISTEDGVNRQLEMGEEYTVRFVTIIPEKAKLKTLKVTDIPLGKPSRLYVVPLG